MLRSNIYQVSPVVQRIGVCSASVGVTLCVDDQLFLLSSRGKERGYGYYLVRGEIFPVVISVKVEIFTSSMVSQASVRTSQRTTVCITKDQSHWENYSVETVCYLCPNFNQNREVWTNFSTNSKTHTPTLPKEMKFHEHQSSGIFVVSCGQTDQRKGFALLKSPYKKGVEE
jgi:hypothetical protein